MGCGTGLGVVICLKCAVWAGDSEEEMFGKNAAVDEKCFRLRFDWRLHFVEKGFEFDAITQWEVMLSGLQDNRVLGLRRFHLHIVVFHRKRCRLLYTRQLNDIQIGCGYIFVLKNIYFI